MGPVSIMSGSLEGAAQFLTVFVIFLLVLAITYYTTRFVGTYQKLQGFNRNFEAIETSEIIKRRDELEKCSSRIYKVAMPTTPKAYAEAQKALKDEGEQFFSESELDLMLPPHLRNLENKGTEK